MRELRTVALIVLAAALAAGCGSDEQKAAPPADADRVLVAALGDSITAGSPAWDPDPGIRETLGTGADPKSQYEFWAEREDPRLEFRNCGVFGERTDQIARRLGECARGAEVLIVQGGINDIAQRRPVKDAAASLRAMVRRGKELGLRVGITDVLPWNNGGAEGKGPIADLNERIAQIAADERVPLLPFHETLEDPQRPGAMRADWTSDGDHPSVEGYRRLGERAFRVPGAVSR